jgi:hypothetical protein
MTEMLGFFCIYLIIMLLWSAMKKKRDQNESAFYWEQYRERERREDERIAREVHPRIWTVEEIFAKYEKE